MKPKPARSTPLADHWGGEFLDAEWFYETVEPSPFPQPWLDHPLASQCFHFPRQLLVNLAQGPRLALLRTETEYIAGLAISLRSNGLREPLELVVDQAGRITLRDGHHRLLATEDIPQLQVLPAHLTMSGSGITVPSAPVAHVLVRMLNTVRPSIS